MDADLGFRRLPHTADERIEAWGPDLAAAAGQAALALSDVMGRPTTLAAGPPFELRVTGADRADLVVRLLSALLAEFEIEGRFVTGVRAAAVADSPDGPVGTFAFDAGRVDRRRERGLAEVKAVTYHGLELRETPGRATVRITLDL